MAEPNRTDPATAAADRPASELGTVVLVAAQLLLVLAVIHEFLLESRTFFQVMLLCTAGFVVHALLPVRYRLPFFAGLSLSATLVALGPLDGSYLIALGILLIGICHLPVRISLRALLLLVTAAAFALWRVELLPAPWSVAIWPLLASMFMFRIALYLYALKYDARRPSLSRTLAYFFMLPNVCFPLFPVVDYSTFARNYYDRESRLIYHSGMKWIARGLVHLVLYRLVYLHGVSDPTLVETVGQLVQFLVATFLLYLRVSGQFHLIIGVLHLFGFRLPDTHHLYFLASGFTDFWRRINIYWKDFMMKLVYVPSYFRLRRFGNSFGLVCSTFIVFLATWLLHSYQWFWLRGGFPLAPQDALFWGILAVLVSVGALREMKRPRSRSAVRAPAWSAALALRTTGTFAAICVLWSLWSAESLLTWLLMWPAALRVGPGELPWLLGLLAAFVLIAGRAWSVWETYDASPRPFYRHLAFQSVAVLACLLVIGRTGLYEGVSPTFAGTIASLRGSTLSARDASLQHKGYYERLDNTSRMSQQLWSVQAQKPTHWVGLSATSAYRVRDDYLVGELVPNTRITFLDEPLSINSLGMRDPERTVEKPLGTYRIALLGPSHVMGSGVADGETFSLFLERRLNRALGRLGDTRYEVLNFGVAGASLLNQLALLRERALEFEPDVVIITDNLHAKEPVIDTLLRIASSGIDLPIPELERILGGTGARALAADGIAVPFDGARSVARALGFDVRMPWTEADRRVRQVADEAIRVILERIAETARTRDAVPVFLALDNVVDPDREHSRMLEDAQASGFVVLDLLDLWTGLDRPSLRIAPWDNHPNAAGNELIAERLFQLLRSHIPDLPSHRASTTEASKQRG